ncbi:hypothetical protein B0H15DRAFT_988167 [Mycena belliarum]|uniref:Uncharacterized protein n=1 Tax=Mycena belliarum TaxID=1033014 RepID=A0AAD6U0A3_9AGAR|nr:hypothetical protein B0H15DRAFT_988167 [Mycena belliae]
MPQPARLLLASCKDHSTQRTSTRRATDERLSPQVDGCCPRWCRPSSQLSSRNSPPPPPPARRLRPSHAAHASTLATPSLQVGGGVVHTAASHARTPPRRCTPSFAYSHGRAQFAQSPYHPLTCLPQVACTVLCGCEARTQGASVLPSAPPPSRRLVAQ